jgi:GntR family transcriptional regulator
VSEINPLDPTPLYQQLAGIIDAKINGGDYEPGKPLPSENTLAQEYGLAKGTVRSAMAELRRRGPIVTMPVRGSYVVERG